MNEFLKILLSLSISGTLLFLLISGLKLVYQNKFSRRWQYYIWIIVVLRFLLPFTPDTTLVGSLFEKIDAAADITTATKKNPASLSVPDANTDAINGSSGIVSETNRIQEASQTPAPMRTHTAKNINTVTAHSFLNVSACLFFLWAVPALVLFVRKITIYQGYIQYIKAYSTEESDINTLNLLSDCKEKLHIKTRLELHHNTLLTSPIMTGFFHPDIILPAGKLKNNELSYIFIHELLHYKQRDMFYKWLIQIAVCIHWFNPFVYLLEKEVNKACELSCDEAVISILDTNARRAYGDMLISFVKSDHSHKNSLASVTLTEGAEQLKERLGAIMNFKKKTKTATIITTILTITVCFCFLAVGAYAAPSANNNTQIWKDTEIINNVLTENGVYYIFCDGADETDKPLSSVSAGSISFVLVRKDGYTSIGPFDNPKTLIEDVTEQCNDMKTLTQEEKELVIETAKNIETAKSNASPVMETLNIKGTTYYLVFNEAQLRAIGTGEYGMDKNYMQQADIELSTDEWIPIGTWDNPFTGTFNGNGYEIIGLTMTDPNAEIIGMFGVARDNAQIYNITLRDFDTMSAGKNAANISAGAIVAIAYGAHAYDNTVYPKETDEDAYHKQTLDHTGNIFTAEASQYYEAGSLPMFQTSFSNLDEEAQSAWLDKIYTDGKIAFFSVSIGELNTDSPLIKNFAEKFYEDDAIAFFSVLADNMTEETLKSWLDKAVKDEKTSFQAMLLGELKMDDELETMEKEWAEKQLKEYQSFGITKKGKNYYYEEQLVNIFLDKRSDSSYYTLSINPKGTVNIQIVRNTDGEITGVFYMTEEETARLLGEIGE